MSGAASEPGLNHSSIQEKPVIVTELLSLIYLEGWRPASLIPFQDNDSLQITVSCFSWGLNDLS